MQTATILFRDGEKGSTTELSQVDEKLYDEIDVTTVITANNQDVEASIRRKLDFHLLPLGILIYFIAFIDRSNMGNARILGMQKELDLVGNRFSISLTAFFVLYMLFEV